MALPRPRGRGGVSSFPPRVPTAAAAPRPPSPWQVADEDSHETLKLATIDYEVKTRDDGDYFTTIINYREDDHVRSVQTTTSFGDYDDGDPVDVTPRLSE